MITKLKQLEELRLGTVLVISEELSEMASSTYRNIVVAMKKLKRLEIFNTCINKLMLGWGKAVI